MGCETEVTWGKNELVKVWEGVDFSKGGGGDGNFRKYIPLRKKNINILFMIYRLGTQVLRK